jgi:Fur family ferric uptake transcriptional regulator
VAASAEAAAQAIRANGLRLSTARRLVLEALYRADSPVKAEEIAAGLDGSLPRSDLASVYRNLETLEQLGLVRHVHLGHGPGRYEPATQPRDYLVCESCESIVSVPTGYLDAAREAIRIATGFRPRFDHFPLMGTCAGCSGSPATA